VGAIEWCANTPPGSGSTAGGFKEVADAELETEPG